MTEPVAYLVSQEPLSSVRWLSDVRPMGIAKKQITPLYTANQLHPRVKMTKEQYKEWQSAINSIYPVDLYELFNLIFNAAKHHGEYMGMRDIFSFNEGQEKLSKLWADFDPDHPEETIEIIPDMKWFVRSKDKYEADPVQGISESGYLYLTDGGDDYVISYCEMTTFKDDATQFDTREEAELWANPDTEAVKLPVEED